MIESLTNAPDQAGGEGRSCPRFRDEICGVFSASRPPSSPAFSPEKPGEKEARGCGRLRQGNLQGFEKTGEAASTEYNAPAECLLATELNAHS